MSKSDNKPMTLAMPRLGETMERGIVADWLVKEGEAFKRGDAIIEFETDKTAVEYPALGAGVLMQQLVQPGDEVEVGAPIALIDVGDGPDWVSEDKESANQSSSADSSESATTTNTAYATDSDDKVTADSEALSDSVQQHLVDSDVASQDMEVLTSGNDSQQPLRATPVARRLALRASVALQAIDGTGRRGRIEANDVEAFVASSPQSALLSASAHHSRDIAVDKQQKRYADGIAYTVSGYLTGPRFLLIHGFAADISAWTLLSRALAKAGCCVVAIDLPGHGATRTDALDAQSLHVGLQSALTDVGENERPWHIVAHSLGVCPALALAQSLTGINMESGRSVQSQSPGSQSVSSLSLISPVGLGLSIDAQFVKGMAKPSSVGELSHLLRRLSERPSTLTASAVNELYAVLKQGRLEQLAESMLGEQGQAVDNHLAIRALSKQLPLRIIIGHADRIIAWQDVLQLAPGVAVHHFPNAGHMPHWDYPGEVAEIILSGQ